MTHERYVRWPSCSQTALIFGSSHFKVHVWSWFVTICSFPSIIFTVSGMQFACCWPSMLLIWTSLSWALLKLNQLKFRCFCRDAQETVKNENAWRKLRNVLYIVDWRHGWKCGLEIRYNLVNNYQIMNLKLLPLPLPIERAHSLTHAL
jgi:hypothetical protein